MNIDTKEFEATVKRLDEISTQLRKLSKELVDTEEALNKHLSMNRVRKQPRIRRPRNIFRNRKNFHNLNNRFNNKNRPRKVLSKYKKSLKEWDV